MARKAADVAPVDGSANKFDPWYSAEEGETEMSPNTGNNAGTDAARRQRGPLLFTAVLLAMAGIATSGCSCRDDSVTEVEPGGETAAQPEVTSGLPDPAERAAELAARPEVTPDLLANGKDLYDDNCLGCHGDRGKGDGKAAFLLLPRPRTLVKEPSIARTPHRKIFPRTKTFSRRSPTGCLNRRCLLGRIP